MQSFFSHVHHRTFFTLLLCLPLWLGATPLEAGATWPALSFKDQNDQPLVADAATRHVIFAAEKPVSDMINLALGPQGKAALLQAKAIYVADISAMPAIISRMFAIPKLRELPFPVGLVREAAQTGDVPRRKGAATVITLDGGLIKQIQFAENEAQLRQALNLVP
jgi:hypothetical protein